MACGKVKWGLKSRAREWGGRAKGVIAGVRGWAQSGGRSWGGALESLEELAGRVSQIV